MSGFAFHSRQQYHLCAVLFRIVFIMTLKLVEGTDEYRIAGLAMKVRNELGFAMLESAYERALILELNKAGFTAERQVPILIFYDGKELNHGYCADIVVDRRLFAWCIRHAPLFTLISSFGGAETAVCSGIVGGLF